MSGFLREEEDSPRTLTGAVPGGTLFRLWGPGFKYEFLDNGEEIYLCTGSCSVRGPLWVHLDNVEWEDINCPDCLLMIDMAERLKEIYQSNLKNEEPENDTPKHEYP